MKQTQGRPDPDPAAKDTGRSGTASDMAKNDPSRNPIEEVLENLKEHAPRDSEIPGDNARS